MGFALPDAWPIFDGDVVTKPILIVVDDQVPNLPMLHAELRKVRFL